ncbi:hypothetical protein RND71_043322 [Anisodus tanguticus]|uniref:Histone acetyltransferase n=1 Tax=Anisodus tanguticus TaxID=243964 RepID=A0AAE1QPT6_9SOLA|nr:hypothetical protein RND71_043322 [Anisodus tanguticus]
MQGWRLNMEDAHTQILKLGPESAECSFFAVFDGHGGSAVANYASNELHKKFISMPEYLNGDIKEALSKCFLEIDNDMLSDPVVNDQLAGSTAIVVVIKDDTIYIANLGDSRAISCWDGFEDDLSEDHKPYKEIELKRIIAAGGWIESDRVNGNLALSRAFGDYVYKKNPKLPPESQIVVAVPDIQTRKINEKLEFVVLACDGIWDVMDSFEVVSFIRDRIAEKMEPQVAKTPNVQPNQQKMINSPLQQQLITGLPQNRPQIRYPNQMMGQQRPPVQQNMQMMQQQQQQQYVSNTNFATPQHPPRMANQQQFRYPQAMQQQQQQQQNSQVIHVQHQQNAGIQQIPIQQGINIQIQSNIQVQQQQQHPAINQQQQPINQQQQTINQQQPLNQQQPINQQQQSINQQPSQISSSADKEKRKLIQQQLVLLLHAHKCQRREQNGSEPQNPSHCASSKQIIVHWKNCDKFDCAICLPLKQASNKRGQDLMLTGQMNVVSQQNINQNNGPSLNMSQTQMQHPQPADMQKAYQTLGLPYDNSSNGTIGISGNCNRIPNSQNSIGNTATINLNSNVVSTKEWRNSVAQDLRSHLVQKIVQAILPSPDANAAQDKRMNSLIQYAQKVENDMYNQAQTREEYYQLLAEKIYKIQKELEDKRAKRKEQQVKQQVISNQQQPSINYNQQNQVRFQICQQPSSSMNQQQVLQQSQHPQPRMSVQPNSQMQAYNNQQIQNNQQSPQIKSVQSQQQPYMQQGQFNNNQGTFVLPPNQTQVRSNNFVNSNVVVDSKPTTLHSMLQNQQPTTPQPVNSTATPPPPRCNSVPVPTPPSSQSQQNQHLQPPSTPQNTKPQTFMQQIPTTPSMTNFSPQLNQNSNLMKSQNNQLIQSIQSPEQQQITIKTEPIDEITSSGSQSHVNSSINYGKTEIIPTCDSSTLSVPLNSSINSENLITENSIVENNLPKVKHENEIKIEKEETEDFITTTSDQPSSLTCTKQTNSFILKQESNGKSEDLHLDSSSALSNQIVRTEEIDIKPSITNNTASTNNNSTSSAIVSANTTKIQRQKKIFKPDELRQALMPTLEKLYRQDPESLPFRQPVDPDLLFIPDYFDIVKKPMDLSTIKRKLDTGQYQDPWQYVEDVYLMFENAWLYNKKTSRVYKYCNKLKEVFEQEIDPVMQSLGYCCGHKFVFTPQTLCCYGKQLCTILRDAKYMCYQNRITYCIRCFQDVQGENVTVDTLDPGVAPQIIPKSQFVECKNDHLDYEPFYDCKDCCRKFHQICVLHLDTIWPEGFVCDGCLKAKAKKRKENKFSAKRLPSTKLGSFIENRVNNYLKIKSTDAGEVFIRVVSSSDKFVEIKPLMKQKFGNHENWPETFPYRAKALFAFEDFNGVDVCFFGMHVQEYGSECSPPNARRVYIAYMDSVHFFKPKTLRTAVYHEILLGYLEYVKQLGYTMAHIWACPPSEGDDYIFHCHPSEQKIPKPKRLQDWYKKMLDKATDEQIVVDYKDILKQATDDNFKSVTELPYFEGDFWPNVIEETINEIESEQKKILEEQQSQQLNDCSNSDSLLNSTNTDEESMGNGFVYTCNKCKRHVVEIRYHCTECDDFDLCVNCYNTEGHNHKMEKLSFSDFGGVLGEDGEGPGSGSFSGNAGGDLDGSGASCNDATSPTEYRRLTIQRCIQSLVHSCQCRDANCRSTSCQRMKRVVAHVKLCKKKSAQQNQQGQSNNCSICKQLIALCCYHAKHCNEQKCPVPYCVNFKNKLQQQRIQQRYEQNHSLMRRIASMSAVPMSTSSSSNSSNSQQSNSSSIVPSPVSQKTGEYSPSPQSSQSPYTKSTVTPPPAGALQAVQQVQAAVARQQQQPLPSPINQFGKGKPSVMPYSSQNNKIQSQPLRPSLPQPPPPPPVPHQQQQMMNQQRMNSNKPQIQQQWNYSQQQQAQRFIRHSSGKPSNVINNQQQMQMPNSALRQQISQGRIQIQVPNQQAVIGQTKAGNITQSQQMFHQPRFISASNQQYQPQQGQQQRFWQQQNMPSQQHNQMMRSPPQQRSSPGYQLGQMPQQNTDMLFNNPQQMQQQQELTPHDQLNKYVENL